MKHICPYCKQDCDIEPSKETRLKKIARYMIIIFCNKTGLDYNKMIGQCQLEEYVLGRAAIAKNVKDELGYKKSYIGSDLFNKDRMTIVHGINRYEQALSIRFPMAKQYEMIINKINYDFKFLEMF